MVYIFFFVDEVGDFVFKIGYNISKYYVVCIVIMLFCEIGEEFLCFCRKFVWKNVLFRDFFYVILDKQEIRDEVFLVFGNYKFEV